MFDFLNFQTGYVIIFLIVHEENWFFKTCPFGSGARMVIQNTYPNLSNIVHTDLELGRVIQTVGAADPGITVYCEWRGRVAIGVGKKWRRE